MRVKWVVKTPKIYRGINEMSENRLGTVYWITGLSGAGKTTVGTKFYNYLKEKQNNTIRLDGDVMREVFRNTDYTYAGRKKLAYQYGSLCKMLSDQGIDVIICTVSMHDEIRAWNRENIKNYKEIYLEVTMEELVRRDQKGLYTNAINNKQGTVSGVTIEAELPKNPDLVIPNYGEVNPDEAFNRIVKFFGR